MSLKSSSMRIVKTDSQRGKFLERHSVLNVLITNFRCIAYATIYIVLYPYTIPVSYCIQSTLAYPALTNPALRSVYEKLCNTLYN